MCMWKERDIINDNDINNDDSDNDDGNDNVYNDDGDDDDDDGLTCYQSLVTNKLIIFIFNLFFDCIYIVVTHFVYSGVGRL